MSLFNHLRYLSEPDSKSQCVSSTHSFFVCLFTLPGLIHIYWLNTCWDDSNLELLGQGGGWLNTAMTNTDSFSAFMELYKIL